MRPETWSSVIVIFSMPLIIFGGFLGSILERHQYYRPLKCYTLLSVVICAISSSVCIWLWHHRQINLRLPFDMAILMITYASGVFATFSFVSLWRSRRWHKAREGKSRSQSS